MTIYTIGHSTRSLETLGALLDAFGVKTLADVRTVPRSRRHPQFVKEALAATLPARGVAYVHLAELGGLRKPRPDSTNGAWENPSFRGYADHMATPAFAAGVERLLALPGPVAVMCAEAVPWRCHRSLLADALVARGVEVRHIASPTSAPAHRLTAFARLDGERVTYPALA